MQKSKILVSGKNGQLGNAIQIISAENQNYEFVFLGREDLDLSSPVAVAGLFEEHKPAYFINCAAYTAVDKAETDQATAYAVNAESVGEIAKQCSIYKTKLIHISTDYVFDGKGEKPYEVDEKTDPINYYGYTKWLGENLALENNPDSVVIRTSWVYSYHGNNFVKTMLRLMKERPALKVVGDQVGSPTYAFDLAEAILAIVDAGENFQPGMYHFSNKGIISWYDFASTIRDMAGLTCELTAITTAEYPTPARRPGYSAMNTEKISNNFGIELKDWKASLEGCLKHL